MPNTAMIYKFVWKNNAEREALFGRTCRIVEPRQPGHVLVEFEDGQRVTVNPRALRRNQESKPKKAGKVKQIKKAKPASFADYFATSAISQLTRITKNDPLRIEALLKVRDYVTKEITS